MSQIELIPGVFIDENDISLSFVRSSGPGGQNVNKVATGVQLRFDIRNSQSLTVEQKERLRTAQKSRISQDDVLSVTSFTYRTQDQNRTSALEKLGQAIAAAQIEPKIRRFRPKPKGSGGGGGKSESMRRAIGKRIRIFDLEDWDE